MPYKAHISAKDVYVRCGPGKNYYPTEKLQPGDEVEIYRHDPGGWYAIRPVEGSFSWVSAHFIEKLEDGLAKVTADRVAARVGSRFSDIRDVIQVRLHQGETVEVIGEKEFQSSSEGGKWCKITPPAGEFRWVHGKFVDPDYMTSGVRKAPGGNSPMVGQASASNEPDAPKLLSTLTENNTGSIADETVPEDQPVAEPGDAPAIPAANQVAAEEDVAGDSAEDQGKSDLEWREDRSAREADLEVKTTEHWSPSVGQPESAASRQTSDSSQPSTAPQEVEKASASIAYRSPAIPELHEDKSKPIDPNPLKPFGVELGDLDLELSIMLAEEPTVWNFDELRLRSQSLVAQAETALERGQGRALADKIRRAEEIKRRYDLVSTTHSGTERQNRQLADLSRAKAAAQSLPAGPEENLRDRQSGVAGRFDGSGRLARVVTPELGAPRYALVDTEGKVTCYVSPAPGVNLHYYVGREVGVTGIRGYQADQDTPHVTVKHVATVGPLR
jgi:uncharacterized protein YgiM (DUF1202 family)